MKGRERKTSVAHIHFGGFLRYHTSNGTVTTERASPVITHQPWTQPLKYYPASLLFPDTFSNRGPCWKLTQDFLQYCLLSWVKGIAEELKGECLCLVCVQTDCSEFSCSFLTWEALACSNIAINIQSLFTRGNEILSFIHLRISDEAMTTGQNVLKAGKAIILQHGFK